MNLIEIFGIASSLVILISLSMTSIIKLRWINMLGCFLFAFYGYMIGSGSTIFLNIGIALINIYFLKKLYAIKENFELILADKNSEYFKHFIKQNSEDLSKFFEEKNIEKSDTVYYMIRNNYTVGVIGWTREEDSVLEIQIDYVTEKFRDMKFGNYLYNENLKFFKELGYSKIIQKTEVPAHEVYVKKLGFKKLSEKRYIKEI